MSWFNYRPYERTRKNKKLDRGVLSLDAVTGKYKIGDNQTLWKDLPELGGIPEDDDSGASGVAPWRELDVPLDTMTWASEGTWDFTDGVASIDGATVFQLSNAASLSVPLCAPAFAFSAEVKLSSVDLDNDVAFALLGNFDAGDLPANPDNSGLGANGLQGYSGLFPIVAGNTGNTIAASLVDDTWFPVSGVFTFETVDVTVNDVQGDLQVGASPTIPTRADSRFVILAGFMPDDPDFMFAIRNVRLFVLDAAAVPV